MWPVFPWSMSDFKPGERNIEVSMAKYDKRVAFCQVCLQCSDFLEYLTRVGLCRFGFSMELRETPGRV